MSDDLFSIEINGKSCQAKPGSMIIEVADEAGILIPRFCYHKKLSVAANCRMCLVEVEKAPKPLPACATPVMDGMKISTKSAYAMQAQKSVMEFLLINHPLDCPICDQGGECELQDVAMGYGRDLSRFNERKRVVKDKSLGPLIATDMTRCIHCTRCVRFGEEIAGLPELGSTGRGEDLKIEMFIERNMESELSGNVIDVCPVGALTSKPFRFRARAWEINQRNTISPHDGVGSNLHVHIKQGKVVRVVPRENDAINEAWISDRDRFSYEGLYSDDRLSTPQVKRDGKWHQVDWETALSAAAQGMRDVEQAHGADQLAALCSPGSTLEEAYLLQKLMRSLGSGNIDHRLRQCDFSDQESAPLAPWLGQKLTDLETSDVTLLIGCDARHEQPMLNHRLRKSVLAGGCVTAINPIAFEFNYPIAAALVNTPAGMIQDLAGVAKALGDKVPALSALLQDVGFTDAHRTIAEKFEAAGNSSIILGAIAAAHPNASVLRALAGHLAIATGARVGYLNEGANATGVTLAGALPHRGPGGGRPLVLGCPASQLIEEGRKAWVSLGIEPEADCFNGAAAFGALQRAEFCVSLTAYDSANLRDYADVILPIAPFAENEGTFVNHDGQWQTFHPAVPASGDARPAWKVLRVLANMMECDQFNYVHCHEVRYEVRALADVELPSIGAPQLPQAFPVAHGGLDRIGDVPMYAGDAMVRRAGALQKTSHASAAQIGLNASLAGRLGLAQGDQARARQDGGDVVLAVTIDDRLPDQCVRIPAGVGGSLGLGASFGPIEIEKA